MEVRGFVSESGLLAVTPYISPFTLKPILGKWTITHIPTGKFIGIEQEDFRVALSVMQKIDSPKWGRQFNPAGEPELVASVKDDVSEYSKTYFQT